MSRHFPALISTLPLTAALLCPFLSRLRKNWGKGIVLASVALSFVCAAAVLAQVLSQGPIYYHMGGWAPPLGIEYVLDPLSCVMAVLITLSSLLVGIYSIAFPLGEGWLQTGGYYTLYGLLTAGLAGMVITGDVFNFYVFLEISALSCYGLVALGNGKGILAAFRYLCVGTVGASMYLLGIGFLYSATGTLNMADMSQRLAPYMDSPQVILAGGSLIVCFGIKMALFPFHRWQSDTYTYAHSAAVPLIAGAMSKVFAYGLLRFFFFIFLPQGRAMETLLTILGLLACAGILWGSVMAIAQRDFRRMLAFSSVAQIGYIVLGFSIGNANGLTGSLLHLLCHALMKGTLFLCIGGIVYRYGETDFFRFGALYQKMPLTTLALVVAAFSMIGLPPTGGFFSKWYLLLGAMEREMYFFCGVLAVSSLLNAVYFFRIIEKIFIQKDEGQLCLVQGRDSRLELPLPMLLPIGIMGGGILALGLGSQPLVQQILRLALPEVIV